MSRNIAGVAVERHVGDRVALVISGRVINFTDAAAGGGIVIPPGHSAATAVAVAPDGYYLTAGHAVRDEPAYLLIPTAAGLHPARTRVVWSGAPSVETDLALVHVPVDAPQAFEWSPRLRADESAVTAACQRIVEGRMVLQMADGWVVRSEQLDATSDLPRRELLLHDVPLTQGYSGGPLFDTDGRLLGINLGLTELPAANGGKQVVGAALRPDLAWLQELIARDRAALRGPTTRR
jgi:S1-C subfamily serine protease